jgi:tetratricopeptide (TPR) repeat protein
VYEPAAKASGENMRNRLLYFLFGAVIILVAVIYWPVIHADFVWDDWPSFHDKPWLTQGNQWTHYIFQDFNSWTFYFRPLAVAFFTLQVRLFDSAPGPMHAVSLCLHLVNTLLVGLLSWRCSSLASRETGPKTWVAPVCMLLYGLHPALIEPVAWIGCQFDLIATMLMLLGLLANAYIAKSGIRAATLAVIFFLAACAKESAISLPLLIVVFDWALFTGPHDSRVLAAFRALLRRNALTSVAIFIAGLAYLVLRYLTQGAVHFPTDGEPASLFARLQEIGFIYLRYLQILVWPVSGMGPIHPIDLMQFSDLTPLLLTDIAALGIFAAGFYFAIRRASPLGCIVMAATAALAPVLHILPVNFDRSLYHERYAMTALAVVCAMLPLLRVPRALKSSDRAQRLGPPLLTVALFFWLAFALVDIRIILPMWSNDTSLWQWALAMNPESSQAKDNLLNGYIRNRSYTDARELGDRILASPMPCSNCMINIATLAIDDKDPDRAAAALERVKHSPLLRGKDMLHKYYLATGRMLILKGDADGAENVLRAAVSLDPLDPLSQSSLTAAIDLRRKQEEAH